MCERLAVLDRVRVRIAVVLLAGLAFLGCGRSGFVHDASSIDTHQFRMEVSAQRYVRSVSGAASIGFVLCAIPTSGGAYRSAMTALHAEAQLKTNEVLVNIREDHTFLPLLFYCQEDLILSADVYEVVPVLAPEHGAAQAERASNFPAPAFRPPPSDSFEPADPYVPPSNPYPPPSAAHAPADAGLRARDPEVCERAHEHLTTDLPGVFHTIFPDARFADAPAKAGFVAACVEQVDDVQLCLQSTFLKTHLAPCRAAFRDMTPEQRTRLFGTFLREW
jgi:hypothetical protein